jgi:hypothetical protein
MLAAVAADSGGLDQDVPGLGPVGTAFMRSAPPMVPECRRRIPARRHWPPRRFRPALSSARAGADDVAIGAGLAEAARTGLSDAGRTAIAHDQVGADADDIERNLARQMGGK